MVPIRRIVAATDLSVSARHAVERAAQLAHSTGASLTLVHAAGGPALEDLRRWLPSDNAERAMLDKASQRLHALSKELAARHQIAVEERVANGPAAEEVARLADDLRAELVVTGSRGESLAHWLVGAVAERIVRMSLRPVLLVRRAPRAPYQRVLVPVDFSIWSESSIQTALRVVPGAHLVLLHAVDAPLAGRMRLDGVEAHLIERYLQAARAEAADKLTELADRAGLAAHEWTASLTFGIDPWTAIIQQEQEQNCDLIVIGKQGRSALGEFLLGSVTRMVISESESDVLIAARHETVVLRARDRRRE